MFRAGDELRVFEGRALERSVAIDQGTVVISILDYGAGNLRSVENTLGAIGAEYELVRDADRAAARDENYSAWRGAFRADDARAR